MQGLVGPVPGGIDIMKHDRGALLRAHCQPQIWENSATATFRRTQIDKDCVYPLPALGAVDISSLAAREGVKMGAIFLSGRVAQNLQPFAMFNRP
jgi:hypothetical protein